MARIKMQSTVNSFVSPSKILTPSVAPATRGYGDNDYVCGSCSTVLLAQVDEGAARNFAVRCPSCGSTNVVE